MYPEATMLNSTRPAGSGESSVLSTGHSNSGFALAAISNGHLYNLRNSRRYRERRLNYTKTRPTTVSISERRKPDPRGQPGYLRIDTDQGDSPTAKGVYHINAVDEVTQWQLPPHGRRPVREDPGA